MTDAPAYATAADAYRAIHAAIGHWIRAGLEGGIRDFRELLELAALMRKIEEPIAALVTEKHHDL